MSTILVNSVIVYMNEGLNVVENIDIYGKKGFRNGIKRNWIKWK